MFVFGEMRGLGIGPACNAAFYGDILVVIQSGNYPVPSHTGRLITMRKNGDQWEKLGMLEGIGSARQMALKDHIAFITAREDGLFVVDIADPAEPVLLCHYDTVEYATGIALSGDLLAISLRQYGLEFIDVSDPAHPRFISLARTGEAQSLCLNGSCAYAGVWGTRELVITDIADLAAPRVVCRQELDGRGDGVAVRDGICFAATGHHARMPKGVKDPDPSTYEKKGNGLEIYDVKDPEHPLFLGGVKFPEYYGLTFDMWCVRLYGDTALVSDTRNGIFAVDISDLRHPRVMDRLVLPSSPRSGHDPITGFAVNGSSLILTGGEGDVYEAGIPCLPPVSPTDAADVAIPRGAQDVKVDFSEGPLGWERALAGHSVRSAAMADGRLALACGEEGAIIADPDTLSVLQLLPTRDICRTVLWNAPYLYTAEAMAGIGIWKSEGGRFVRAGQFTYDGHSLLDLELSGSGSRMLAQYAGNGVLLLDMTDPGRPRPVGKKTDCVGLMYGRHFPSRGIGDTCYFSVGFEGLNAVTGDENGIRITPVPFESPDFYESGIDRIPDGLFCCSTSGYAFLACDGNGELAVSEPVRWRRFPFDSKNAKARVFGDLLVLTRRDEGWVRLCDISDRDDIRLLSCFRTTASPEPGILRGDRLYIPGGRMGLIVITLGGTV